MVDRRIKIGAAILSLALGLLLAWPLRRQASAPGPTNFDSYVSSTPAAAQSSSLGGNAVFPASAVAADQVPLSVQSVAAQFTADALAAEVVTPQSTVVSDNRDQTLPTPLLAVSPTQSNNANSTGQPVYTVGAAVNQASDAAAPDGRYRIHVVHPGDSLDRLAERYLNDEARSFEIFNLNSDVLANPHLLPIGAELKIPVPPASD